MRFGSNLLIGAACAVGISVLPVNFETVATGSVEPAAAFGKGGNGNGGGGNGGNGGGRGGERGKSAEARGHNKSGHGATKGRSAERLLGSLFDTDKRGARKKASVDKVAKSSRKAGLEVRTAALPQSVAVPAGKPKNFNARLAGLNSLKRNYNAYMNSQSPRFAAVFDYVMDSATGAIGIDDALLEEALLAAANRNRVDQYGEDYIDEDTLGWAKEILGVGDQYGKIDEVQESLEADAE